MVLPRSDARTHFGGGPQTPRLNRIGGMNLFLSKSKSSVKVQEEQTRGRATTTRLLPPSEDAGQRGEMAKYAKNKEYGR